MEQLKFASVGAKRLYEKYIKNTPESVEFTSFPRPLPRPLI